MRKNTIFLTVLILAVATSTLSAQQTFRSLDEIWSFALASNAGQNISQMQVQQAVQDKKTAGSFLLPSVSAGFNGQQNIDISETPVPGELVGKPGETVYMQFGKRFSYNAGINLNYSLPDWRIIYQLKMAEINVELKKAEKSYSEQTLKEQAGQVYFATLTAQQAIEIGMHDLAVADTLLMLSEQRFYEGITDAVVVNQARVNRNSVAQNLESTQQYYNECVSNLKILLGIDAGADIILTQNPADEMIVETGLFPAENTRYTEVYRLQKQYAETGAKKAKAEFLPQAGLYAYFGYNQFQDDFSVSFESDQWRPSNYVGFSLKIPVFTGFASKSKYESARIGHQIAAGKYEDELRKSAISDTLLYQKTMSSGKIAATGLENFNLSAQNVKLAVQKYKQGLLSLDGYLNIFDDYLKAENVYLNYLSEYLIGKASIESRKQ